MAVQYRRYYLKGMKVTTYDAESSVGTTYSNIVTSELNDDGTFGVLGTVFSIRAYGYRAYVEGTDINDLIDMQFDGASRVCVSTADGSLMELEALCGYNSEGRALWFPGYYSTDGRFEGYSWSGLLTTDHGPRPNRYYVTPVYQAESNDDGHSPVMFYFATDAAFSPTNYKWWPYLIMDIVESTIAYGDNPNTDWIMSRVEAIPIDTLVPLPGVLTELTQRGATGVQVGLELHLATGEVIDISDEAQYKPYLCSFVTVDENRQIIIDEESTLSSFTIHATWAGLPGETVNIGFFFSSDVDPDPGGSGGGGEDPNPEEPDPEDPNPDTPTVDQFTDSSFKIGITVAMALKGFPKIRGDRDA